MSLFDAQTQDLTRSRLKLKKELLFVPQTSGQRTMYHIEVPSRSEFYRIGFAEYCFVSLLDGRTTFAEALTLTARALGPEALTRNKALSLSMWLLESDLASIVTEGNESPGGTMSPGKPKPSWFGQLNPFWMKIPLMSPDRLLKWMLPATGWLFSKSAIVLQLLLAVVAFLMLQSDLDRFSATSAIVVSPDNWIWMLGIWIVLKIVHELAHGLACRRYGGTVRETGIVFILFAPMAWVDVTSSWRFPSRWQRIHVAAAGMLVEVTIAAIAVICWQQSNSEFVQHLAFNIVFMAGLSTLLFNANPLMRFDGYYILSDLLGLPNLYTRGSQAVQRITTRVFFGSVTEDPDRDRRLRGVVAVYGMAAFIWRMLICVSLLVAASVLFRGAGTLLAIGAAVLWFGAPLVKLMKSLPTRWQESPGSMARAGIVSGLTLTLLIAIWTIVPWPFRASAPGIVEYSDSAIVRCEASGFISDVLVQDGETVTAGTILVTLRNDELVAERDDLLLAIRQADVRRRVAMDDDDATTAQVELANRQALTKQLQEREAQVQALTMTAPVDGRVVARGLRSKTGSYVHEGDELLVIGNESQKEFVLSFHQQDVMSTDSLARNLLRIRIGTRPATHARLTRVEPRATTSLPHLALAATQGGPLPVTTDEKAESDQHAERLTQPRFKAIVALSATDSRDLQAGELGYAVFASEQVAIGTYVTAWFDNWLRRQLRAAEQ